MPYPSIGRCARAVAAGLAFLIGAAGSLPAAAQRFETKVEHALLIDAESGSVLFEKAADVRMPPASLAKLMTMTVVFDALAGGRLSLDDTFVVSENAWRSGGAQSGGSTMFAKLNSTIKVQDLIRGVIIQSGNDACIVLAEGMAGSEAAFADVMNAEARKLGLKGSHFTNATGLPNPDQYVTAYDLAAIARHIIYDFPEYYPIYKETEFTWNKIRQQNRNPLLTMGIGADGMKTGFTDESGYGLVGSAVRDGQRLIVIINGAASDKERGEEARKLLDWGFRAFERISLFDDGRTVADATVFGGLSPAVGLVSKGGVEVLVPRGSRDLIKGRVVYDGPVRAPVVKGQAIGSVEISLDDRVLRRAPLYADRDIGIGTLSQRAFDGLRELLLGWL